jgi:hypothetical protein
MSYKNNSAIQNDRHLNPDTTRYGMSSEDSI